MKQTIRIIGGHFRGKKIHFPVLDGLRPTPDRVRETLFNWLMHDIRDARCLDAFAGSGALGFEAYSRGASNVLLIENAPIAYKNLQTTALSFNTPNIRVIKTNACDYLQTAQECFDIIFLDPPFANHYYEQFIAFLASSPVLRPKGLLYIESPNEQLLDPANWEKLKLKQAGVVTYALYRKNKP